MRSTWNRYLAPLRDNRGSGVVLVLVSIGMLALYLDIANPINLPNGETRTWLEDGDSVVLRGWCEKPGAARIGFGEVRATVLPARQA